MIQQYGEQAKQAKYDIANLSTADKNKALIGIAEAIKERKAAILHANKIDIEKAQEKGLSNALIDRLSLDDKRINGMIDGITKIAALPDPVGEITGMHRNEKGIQIGRMRSPIGVIAIIYESRPNVTADAAAICLKSGNAVILRGGSEAFNSNLAIATAIKDALRKNNINENIVQFIEKTDRELVTQLLNAKEYIDIVIPRGGAGLVSVVSEQAKMPVIKHLNGICHLYVDKDADLEKALRVADNGKTYRYGICGATETMLVHQDIAETFLPKIAEIFRNKNVEMRGCERTQALINCKAASDIDWRTEYLDAIISIKIVNNLDEAIFHINEYSSKHTESIATENLTTSQKFLNAIDSASVMVNTPTCFADGYEYGLGAEIGISTDKLHWRGPVGIVGLTCEKFILFSDGVIRE